MSYGSEKTEKLKTKRITSLPITNKVKKLRLAQHFDFANKQDADVNASRVIYSRFFVNVLRESLHKLVEGQYVPILIKKENLRLKLTSFYEVDNECQRLNKFSGSETPPFRAG